MAKLTNTQRIEVLEQKMDKILEILTSQQPQSATKGSSKKATKSVDKDAQREAEKANFKANHKLVRSSKENKQLVYDEMKKQGIKEFNRKDYERIAKGLGVLGKSGKVVATWEEAK